jgi:23S rRNA (adenine2503-C2)-methyltransferase
MKVVGLTGRDDLAITRIAEVRRGKYVEFVESLQPPLPRARKWVLIVSTMFGCPVGCLMCDAGSHYGGKLSAAEILSQIDYLVTRRFPDKTIRVDKFKVQFARMGEPSLNMAVLDVLRRLPILYKAPGLMPSISTVAPAGCERFFEELAGIKADLYPAGRFQLQFSIHTTDAVIRDRMIPISKWDLGKISRYGERFYEAGDRKITLNAALVDGMPLDADVLLGHFDPAVFLIKITPVNPTYQARKHRLSSYILPPDDDHRFEIVSRLRDAGFTVLVSIGEIEENLIGSNCGQYVTRHLNEKKSLEAAYTYDVCREDVALP